MKLAYQKLSSELTNSDRLPNLIWKWKGSNAFELSFGWSRTMPFSLTSKEEDALCKRKLFYMFLGIVGTLLVSGSPS
ncbi:hypothetical protein AHAS_Ahas12G0084100 [Arachis hypogaea]